MRARPVFRLGPGLNAANMVGRGWLDKSRVWSTNNESFDTVVTLRPLHRRDLPGFLAARLGRYLVEFRIQERWDAAIDRAAVLIHRFDDNQSYLMSARNGDQDLVAGSVFGTTDTGSSAASIFTGATGVEVVEINPTNGSPRLNSFIGPLLKNQVLVEFCLAVLPRVAKDIFLCLGQVSFLFRRIHHLFNSSASCRLREQRGDRFRSYTRHGATRNTFGDCFSCGKSNATIADFSTTRCF